ncbi:hypothetical protein GIB67_041572, partial [Kingdonia uniflora]
RRAVGSTNANKLGSRSHLLIHTQGCHQMMDEAEKDYKNMSDRIVASVETSYADFITEAQTSAARGSSTANGWSIGCVVLRPREA